MKSVLGLVPDGVDDGLPRPVRGRGHRQGDSATRTRAPRSSVAFATALRGPHRRSDEHVRHPARRRGAIRGVPTPRAGDHGPLRSTSSGARISSGSARSPTSPTSSATACCCSRSRRWSSAASWSGRRWCARSRPAPPTPGRGGRSAPTDGCSSAAMVLPDRASSVVVGSVIDRRGGRAPVAALPARQHPADRARHRVPRRLAGAPRVRPRPRGRGGRRRGASTAWWRTGRCGRRRSRGRRRWATGPRASGCRRPWSSAPGSAVEPGRGPARGTRALGAGGRSGGRARRGGVLHVPVRHRRRARARRSAPASCGTPSCVDFVGADRARDAWRQIADDPGTQRCSTPSGSEPST